MLIINPTFIFARFEKCEGKIPVRLSLYVVKNPSLFHKIHGSTCSIANMNFVLITLDAHEFCVFHKYGKLYMQITNLALLQWRIKHSLKSVYILFVVFCGRLFKMLDVWTDLLDKRLNRAVVKTDLIIVRHVSLWIDLHDMKRFRRAKICQRELLKYSKINLGFTKYLKWNLIMFWFKWLWNIMRCPHARFFILNSPPIICKSLLL